MGEGGRGPGIGIMGPEGEAACNDAGVGGPREAACNEASRAGLHVAIFACLPDVDFALRGGFVGCLLGFPGDSPTCYFCLLLVSNTVHRSTGTLRWRPRG